MMEDKGRLDLEATERQSLAYLVEKRNTEEMFYKFIPDTSIMSCLPFSGHKDINLFHT